MRRRTDTPDQIEIPGMEEMPEVRSVLDLTSEDVEKLKRKKPKTLGIVCTRTACDKELHCFRPEMRNTSGDTGRCQECGVELVDFAQMHTREALSVSQKFGLLQKEWIRHFFFHVPLTPRVEAYARKHGSEGLTEIARQQLSKGKMLRFNKDWDFNQTKMLDGTIVHWGRHAVACCCRRCMAYWHHVPLDAALSSADIDYFGQLVVHYVKYRIPDLDRFGAVSGHARVAERIDARAS